MHRRKANLKGLPRTLDFKTDGPWMQRGPGHENNLFHHPKIDNHLCL